MYNTRAFKGAMWSFLTTWGTVEFMFSYCIFLVLYQHVHEITYECTQEAMGYTFLSSAEDNNS